MIKFLVPEESWGSIDSKYANIFEENSRKVPRKLQETSGIFQENQILKFQNHENVVRQSGFDPLRAAKLCGIDRSHREGKTVLSDFQKNVSKIFWSIFCENFVIFWKYLGKLFSFLGFSRGFPGTFLKYFLKKRVQLDSTLQWAQKLDHTIKTREDIYVLLSFGANCPDFQIRRTTNSATYSNEK